MKKLIYILSIALAFVSCKETPKDYATLSGTITNKNSDSLVVMSRSMKEVLNPETNKMEMKPVFFSKKITVNEDGTFSDTLKVEKGNFMIMDGKERSRLYLENGYDLQVTLNGESFNENMSFTGIGSEVNTYINKKNELLSKLFYDESLYDLSEEAFNERIATTTKDYEALVETIKPIKEADTAFMSRQQKDIEGVSKQLTNRFQNNLKLTALTKGKASPKFTDYENNAGGTTSLDDLKGKYVYVDVWATWCGPCKREIPFLKKVEKAYHNKNIEFVSISIDKASDHEKWKKMIADKELGGVQLLADADWKSQFVQDYAIQGIPRFILIDPNGNIVTPDAPRPSDEKLKDLFTELNI
ncbi:TlpA disulfide reductase family protein [uncultured Algibacter sp.]|uniref:TlpA family protein disulfide reductase n=1 Tax=uncultured Algibacter sp. TaxID=298659 RepID=UPI0026377CBB|nr:TlpA disulfide reductase family protein [uncultured Algibacter sp.]